MIDMKGAIQKPGVYEAKKGERVIDLIERAGGFSDMADQSKVNLAMYVEDQMVIAIPQFGDTETDFVVGTSVGDQSQPDKVNINKADETELETLPGIGPSKSAAIIEYRTTTCPFKSIEEIQSISGIGEKTFEKLKDKITID
ncbi:helix-hairpin-helix domain-containing protein [Bacillus sp. T3]|uniref:helix-hairpin-helix domain-containing protein n=1 Tax=Bacillus sp. T3 TaxID=467262 RepID=UPI002980AF39|nr:helix-hairpin-helix domain-containing protein [Bacillus sp. T3]